MMEDRLIATRSKLSFVGAVRERENGPVDLARLLGPGKGARTPWPMTRWPWGLLAERQGRRIEERAWRGAACEEWRARVSL